MTTFETTLLNRAKFPTDGRVFDRVTIVRQGQWPNTTAHLVCEIKDRESVSVYVDVFGESGSRAIVKNPSDSKAIEVRAFCSDGYPILVCAREFAQDNSEVWDMESDHEETDSPDITEEGEKQ
ncbi:MAG: hypothetical protein PHF83_05445 [Candidatus Methanomethylophilus sp.]|nr:hypothetical protein [Methanomethylophilus sp.]